MGRIRFRVKGCAQYILILKTNFNASIYYEIIIYGPVASKNDHAEAQSQSRLDLQSQVSHRPL